MIEILLILLVASLLCIIVHAAPTTEVIGLFFLLGSFSITKWANNINEQLTISVMWLVLFIYILVIALRFRIDIIKCFTNIPKKNGIYLILLVFGVYSLVGTIYSMAPVDTIKRSFGYILAAYFFFAFLPALFLKTNNLNIKRLFFYLDLAFLIPVVTGLFLFYTNSGEVSYMQGPFQRFVGVYGTERSGLPGNPNAVGYVSFLLGSISIIGYIINREKYIKLFYIGTIIVSLMSILASSCRSALLVFVVVLILMSVLRIRTAIAYIVFGAVLLLFFQYFGVINTMENKIMPLTIVQRIQLQELGGRIEIWREGIASLNGLQFLTGYGLGSITETKHTKMMNIYVELFVETGLIGISLFALFLFLGFMIVLKRWRYSDTSGKKLWAGVLAFYCGLCVYGFSESLLAPSNPLFHLLLLSITLSLSLLPQQINYIVYRGKPVSSTKQLKKDLA